MRVRVKVCVLSPKCDDVLVAAALYVYKSSPQPNIQKCSNDAWIQRPEGAINALVVASFHFTLPCHAMPVHAYPAPYPTGDALAPAAFVLRLG